MTIVPRRLATLLLLLVVPLRVYAATAMVLCGQSITPMPALSPAAMHAGTSEASADPCSVGHGARSDRHDAGSADDPDHLSCAACCCSGMIATARHDWKPQSFATPATTPFVAIAVPPPVPDRLERPPRAIVV